MSPRTTRRLRLTFAVIGTLTALLGVVCLTLPFVLSRLMPLPPGTRPPLPPYWGGLLYLGIAAASFYVVARTRPVDDQSPP